MVCSVLLTLVVCSVLCYVVSSSLTLAEGMDLWNSSETTARVWIELRTCLRDRVKEMGFITVITLTESLTRLMKSLTRALGSQRVLCTGCWWFGQACCSLCRFWLHSIICMTYTAKTIRLISITFVGSVDTGIIKPVDFLWVWTLLFSLLSMVGSHIVGYLCFTFVFNHITIGY